MLKREAKEIRTTPPYRPERHSSPHSRRVRGREQRVRAKLWTPALQKTHRQLTIKSSLVRRAFEVVGYF
jgi:hypothetical protein